MLDILNQIATTFVSMVQFVINTIESFVNLISKIPQYTAFMVQAIGLLPAIMIPFAIASISIYVVLMILGRNS